MAGMAKPLARKIASTMQGHALGKGVAAAYASFPAPAGFRWDFLTSAGQRVTVSGRPVVVLVGA